jgi:hypothetical protein
MKRLLLILACACHLQAATYTESHFGFDASAADNWDALKSLEAHFASGGDGDTITFAPGIYNIISQSSPMATITGRSNWSLIGTDAVLQSTNTSTARWMFQLVSCTNATINLNFQGGRVTTAKVDMSPIFLPRFNNTIYLSGVASNCFRHITVGMYDSGTGPNQNYIGNTNIHAAVTNFHTHYGVVAYRVHGLYFTNRSHGPLLGRAFYSAANTNVVGDSGARDSFYTDSIHLMTTLGYDGVHYGNDGITLKVKELGSTSTASGPFAGVTTQSDSGLGWDWLPVTNRNISIDFDVVATPDGFGLNNRLLFSLYSWSDPDQPGGPMAHENIVISGTFDRSHPDNNNIGAAVQAVGWKNTSFHEYLSHVQLDLRNFHDLVAPGQDPVTIYTRHDRPVPATITACSSTINKVSLGHPSVQTYTDLGDCEAPPPSTLIVVALGDNAYQTGTVPQSFRVYRSGGTAALSVNYTMSGTAANGTHYETISSPLAMAENEDFVDVVIQPIDVGASSSSTAVLTLAAGSDYTVGSPSNATITILPGAVPAITTGTRATLGGTVTIGGTWTAP